MPTTRVVKALPLCRRRLNANLILKNDVSWGSNEGTQSFEEGVDEWAMLWMVDWGFILNY